MLINFSMIPKITFLQILIQEINVGDQHEMLPGTHYEAR